MTLNYPTMRTIAASCVGQSSKPSGKWFRAILDVRFWRTGCRVGKHNFVMPTVLTRIFKPVARVNTLNQGHGLDNKCWVNGNLCPSRRLFAYHATKRSKLVTSRVSPLLDTHQQTRILVFDSVLGSLQSITMAATLKFRIATTRTEFISVKGECLWVVDDH